MFWARPGVRTACGGDSKAGCGGDRLSLRQEDRCGAARYGTCSVSRGGARAQTEGQGATAGDERGHDRQEAGRRPPKPSEIPTTKPESLLKHHIPTRTYTVWDEERPGLWSRSVVRYRQSTAGTSSSPRRGRRLDGV